MQGSVREHDKGRNPLAVGDPFSHAPQPVEECLVKPFDPAPCPRSLFWLVAFQSFNLRLAAQDCACLFRQFQYRIFAALLPDYLLCEQVVNNEPPMFFVLIFSSAVRFYVMISKC